MTRVRVHNLMMSLDGFVAGPDQSIDAPMGVGAERIHSGCSPPGSAAP